MQGNIYLVGPMGAGKTTVGRILARSLHCDFVDTDRLLEERTGVSVGHIFEIEGEAGFRDRECKLLKEVSQFRETVIATGGGIVLRKKNRQILCKGGPVIYLQACLGILLRRLRHSQTRPLLQSGDPKAVLEKLMHERDPLYRQVADLVVRVSSDSSQRTAARILHQLP